MPELHVYDKLTSLLRLTFDSDDLVASPELTFDAITGADSLGKVRLFLEVEDAFGVRFSTVEIGALNDIEQLAQLIQSKCVARS